MVELVWKWRSYMEELYGGGLHLPPPISKAASPPSEAPSTSEGDTIEIKIQFGKVSKVVRRRLASTVGELKAEIERETGVPVANQKLLFKGQLKDERCVAGARGIDD